MLLVIVFSKLHFVLPGSTHIVTPRRLLDDIKALTVTKSKDSVYFKDE